MKELRYFRMWLALGVGMVLVIAYLSLMPSPPSPVSFAHVDKIEHCLAYAVLMIWFVQLFERSWHIGVLVALLSFSIGIEVLQGLGGFRVFDIWDIMANLSGLGLGWACGGTKVAHALARYENLMILQRKRIDDR
ncbi:MAG: VanZ family protein [Pseudomonadota bacterium]